MPRLPSCVVLCAALAAACSLDPFPLELGAGVPDARRPADAGPPPGDAGGGDGGCVRQPERCDGIDNDCDGVIDNGFNLDVDPENCGRCGNACDDAAANQRGSCVGGACVYACAPGFIDCLPTQPGCETACIRTNGGVEICDGLDNDCNCRTDEGFNTQTDPENCGTCGHVCFELHAQPLCNAGVCAAGPCDPGFADLRPDIEGCEYRCPIWPPRANDATCDGVDDDCDGAIDEDVPGIGDPCDTGAPGECAAGTLRCIAGAKVCFAQQGAVPELCDGKDNDCDGVIDNGFDLKNDPSHCGAGCQVCAFQHGFAGCVDGRCVMLGCEPGWADADGQVGCEYACTRSGPEVCDGIDNDCDGLIDAADPDLVRPDASFCASRGTCAGAALACRTPPAGCADTTVAWRCIYPAPTQVDACGNLVAQESLCDGKDNDCDGAVDEPFTQVGTPCNDGALGICKSSGTFACDPADPQKQRVVCQITAPGQKATQEVCNGRDDDCDGVVDNGARDDLVHVAAGGLDFWIYRYEASRPDASAASPGSQTARSCSQAGVLPWSLVSWTEADAACAAAGKRLCTEDEWQTACGGAAATLYPYGDTYEPEACNGNDYDPNCSGPDDDQALPTGTPYGCPKPAASACVSTLDTGLIYDMSGNLREWTATEVGAGLRRIRGGGYDNVAEALTCRFDFWSQEESSFYFNLGFRCCADKADP